MATTDKAPTQKVHWVVTVIIIEKCTVKTI
jgi:hypothetical protein